MHSQIAVCEYVIACQNTDNVCKLTLQNNQVIVYFHMLDITVLHKSESKIVKLN